MIATLDELAAGLARAQSACLRKSSLTLLANDLADLFHQGGGFPANAALSGSADGVFPSNVTAGAIPFNDPTAGDSTLIGRIAALSSSTGMLSVADRIWFNHLNAFPVTKINIVWPTAGVQRYADGIGVELYASITANLANTTAATWTVEFHDQDGVLTTATAAYGSSGAAGRMIPFNLPAGVTGIKKVLSFQSSVAQASGSISLVLAKRLIDLPVLASIPVSQDGIALGLPSLEPAACLFALMFMGSTTSSGTFTAKLDFVQG